MNKGVSSALADRTINGRLTRAGADGAEDALRRGSALDVGPTENQNTITGTMVVTGPNKNKEIVQSWIAFANKGFLGSFDQFIANDYIGHLGGTNMNRSELERVEREFCVAFPDAVHSIDELIAENDLVVLRSTARATHRGDFQGIAVTGRSVEFTAIVIYRIQDGKIAESWGEVDFLRLMRQLRSGQPAG